MLLHDSWRLRLDDLQQFGERVGPRGIETREQIDAVMGITSCRDNLVDSPARGLNYRFAVAEWIWMSMGLSDVETLAFYNSKMRDYSDDGARLTGAYGPHICAQKSRILDLLHRDPNTRQAVIEILRPRRDTKDEPCTLSFQYLLRKGHLNTIVTMRSSDAWLGIPYDMFTFGQISNALAGELGVERGWVSLHMGSSHLYERDTEGATRVLRDVHHNTIQAPELPGWPPSWFYDVVTAHDVNAVPHNVMQGTSPWSRYVRALLAKTSEEARSFLIG